LIDLNVEKENREICKELAVVVVGSNSSIVSCE
jgi:hypothetical protein